ncbi:hypothetical protein KCU91_g112, partial [Aureobasidium melanogenum]
MLGTLTERCITLSRSFDVEALIELLGTPRMHPSKDVLQLTVFRSSISSSETPICHYRSTAVVFDKQVATHRHRCSWKKPGLGSSLEESYFELTGARLPRVFVYHPNGLVYNGDPDTILCFSQSRIGIYVNIRKALLALSVDRYPSETMSVFPLIESSSRLSSFTTLILAQLRLVAPCCFLDMRQESHAACMIWARGLPRSYKASPVHPWEP